MGTALIATLGDENWVLSADGSLIYVAGNDGFLKVFDAHSGTLLHSVDLGIDLGAISLSPDGTRLAVVEEVPENVRQYQTWTENSADVSLYIVNLDTFAAQELTYHVTADSYTFADVTWTDNDTLQLSQNILPGWSGWAPLAKIELSTGALTEHSSYYSGLGTSASLLTIPGTTTVLLGQLGLSSAQYFLIAPDGTAFANNGIYANDVYGYAGGIEAASGTTASDRIVIVTGGDAHLYSGTMQYIGNLTDLYPSLGTAAGVTFSADGQRMFFLDTTNQAVVVIDAYNYALVATVSLPGANFATLQWSEEIVVAPDGSGVYYNTASGIAYVAIDLPDLGTNLADQLSGTTGNDIIDGLAGSDSIYGLAGDDWLIGGAGNDLIDGGEGYDIASYETATAGVTVNLGIATAQATGGGDADTLVSIEGLSGSILNDTLTGNAGANVLLGYDGDDTLWGLAGDDDLYGEIGNDWLYGGLGVDWLYGGSGNDHLDGGEGADRLEGGDGNDIYVVDNAADVIIETATGGYDTMLVSNFSATIAGSVEALVIQSGAVDATGNFAANSLTGSDQANVLSGLGGSDVIQGGAGNDTLVGGSGIDSLTGGPGDDIFRDTVADLNGDTIVDFSAGDRIVFTNATLSGFTFSLSGSTLTYTGGSLTLTGFTGTLVASAAAGGGVQLSIQATVIPDAANDFNGDGRSDILWRNVDGTLSNWLGQPNGGFVPNDANAAVNVPLDWHVIATGDLNGDGRDDILWRNADGTLSNWLGQANGSFTPNNANGAVFVPTDWNVIGVADFNGDGRDDILWRQDGGTISNWLSTAAGGYTPNNANAAVFVPTDWIIAGLGDFNGDGRADILWRHTDGTISNWLGTAAGGYTPNDVNAAVQVPNAWSVIGVGDFNGDGRDDILWRHTDGTISNWLGTASGGWSPNDANAAVQVPLEWSVVAIGDYNGDGRDDILWRHTDGTTSNWLGTASGGWAPNDANAAAPVPNVWIVQPEDYLV